MLNEPIENRIKRILQNSTEKQKIANDLGIILQKFGLDTKKSAEICHEITENYLTCANLEEASQKGYALMQQCKIIVNHEEIPILSIMQKDIATRPYHKLSVLKPYLQHLTGKTLDYGAGNGVLTQLIADNLHLDIEGVDIQSEKVPNVTIKMLQFDGAHVPVPDKYYDNGLLVQVLHHAENYEQVLQELSRIVKHNLIVRESTSVGKNDDEMRKNLDHIFMLDFLYGKVFCNSDMPTPGTFFTPSDWIKIFAKFGWQCVKEIDEGFDPMFPPFRHGLWIFKR